MTRSFDARPIDPEWLEELCASALWAPSAGNSAGVRLHVVAAAHVAQFFDVATDPRWRREARRAPGLMRAGAVVLVTADPECYFSRYGDDDKVASGLGRPEAWPIPYWHADAAMATMALLLLLEEARVGATIWGSFRHAQRILEWAGVATGELFASILIGYPDGHDTPSSSLQRAVPARRARVSRVRPLP